MTYYLGKIVGAFSSPPGLFLLLLAISLPLVLSARRGRKAAGAILLGASFLLTLLCSLRPLSGALLRPLELRWPALAPVSSLSPADFSGYDAVVVLGADDVPFSPEEGGRTALGAVMCERLVYGLRLAGRLGLPLVVTGTAADGGGADGIAKASERLASELGLTKVPLSAEWESRTTWENAQRTKELFRKRGIARPRVLLVTSAWHMDRGMQSFRAFGFLPTPAPTEYRTSSDGPSFVDWLPSADALRNSGLALHEYVGLASYSLRRAPR